jgi:hypothetical protein
MNGKHPDKHASHRPGAQAFALGCQLVNVLEVLLHLLAGIVQQLEPGFVNRLDRGFGQRTEIHLSQRLVLSKIPLQ